MGEQVIVIAGDFSPGDIGLGHFDGIFLWGPNSDEAYNKNVSWANGAHQNGRIYVGYTSPGFDDRATRGTTGDNHIYHRLTVTSDPGYPHQFGPCPSGKTCNLTYNVRWNTIINSVADWAIIETFNDWNEATMIERAQNDRAVTRSPLPYLNYTETNNPGCGTGTTSKKCLRKHDVLSCN